MLALSCSVAGIPKTVALMFCNFCSFTQLTALHSQLRETAETVDVSRAGCRDLSRLVIFSHRIAGISSFQPL